jgi:hypothetical protein
MSKIGRVGFVIKPHAPGVEDVLRDLVAYLGERGDRGAAVSAWIKEVIGDE